MNTPTIPAASERRPFAILSWYFLFLLAGCATGPSGPTKTSLELQAIQAREFETSKQVAFAATTSVFQDLGYIITSADLETGFITFKSPTHDRYVLFVGTRMTDVRATAFIESIAPGRTRVRLNFVTEERESAGQGIKAERSRPIEHVKPYRDAFTRIQKAIFVRTTAR